MVYKLAPGARLKTPPAIVGQLMEELSQTEEGLTAQTLLDASRPKNSPLHNEFEWDNREAAEKYRLHQAGYIIRSIVIVADETKPAVYTRAVVTVEDGKYEPTQLILRDEGKREKLLAIALRDLRAYERRYNNLAELAPLWPVLREIEGGTT